MSQTTDSKLDDAVISITDEARGVVVDALAQEPNGSELGLFIEVRGIEAGKFAYDLYFQATADVSDDDAVVTDGDVKVVVPAASIERLKGARLEWSTDNGGGLVMVNPNVPSASEVAPGVPEHVVAQGLEGPLAIRVVEVLEREVNPSIASHGGRADLVAIDEANGIAYLALSGGCQGCAMSRMTLSQGIEVSLRDNIVELTEVIDVTDHATGENPFYSN